MPAKTVLFHDWLDTQMADPEFRKAYEELEPAYQIARLRIMRGLTQEALAERAGLSVRGISDLERGVNRTPRRDTLALLEEALQPTAEADRAAFVAAEAMTRAVYRAAEPGIALLRLAQGRTDAALAIIRRATDEASGYFERPRLLGPLVEIALTGRGSTVAQAISMWPEKRLFVNFPSSVHLRPYEQVRAEAEAILEAGGHTGRLEIQISENVPPFAWPTSLPAIADAIDAFRP